MADVRLRMVLFGLVLGVIVAVIVAAQGCGGSKHPRRHVGGGSAVAAAAAGGGGGSGNAAINARAHAARRVVRRSDSQGPFFGFRRGHVARVDAPRAGGRLVALTFDDGPGPQTGELLDELRRLRARATFFVVGSMAAIRPDIVKREARDRMGIGNHTWSHPILTTIPAAMQRTEIERDNAILRKLTGRRPRFFRPPGWRFEDATARIVEQERMIGTLRTADTRDWSLPGVRAIIRSALRVKPGGIVAMHDAGGYTRTETLAAVPHIVRGLRRRHLRLVTVGELYDGRS